MDGATEEGRGGLAAKNGAAGKEHGGGEEAGYR